MKEDVIGSLRDKVSTLIVTPIGGIGSITVGACERIADVQISALQYFSKLGFERWRSAASINDYDSAQEFAVKQIEVVGDVGKKLMDDSRRLLEIGKAYTSEVKDVLSKPANDKSSKAPVVKKIGEDKKELPKKVVGEVA